MQHVVFFVAAVTALSTVVTGLGLRLLRQRRDNAKRVASLSSTIKQLENSLGDQKRVAEEQVQALREQLDGASRTTDEALGELEVERRRYKEVFDTIQGIVGERDKWRELYDKQGREYGAAQALLVEQNDRLARIAIRHGAKIKLHPVLAALREDHGIPELPTGTIMLEVWELLAGVAPGELTLSQRLKRAEELASSGCAWSSKYPDGAKLWTSKVAETMEQQPQSRQLPVADMGGMLGSGAGDAVLR